MGVRSRINKLGNVAVGSETFLQCCGGGGEGVSISAEITEEQTREGNQMQFSHDKRTYFSLCLGETKGMGGWGKCKELRTAWRFFLLNTPGP